MRAIMQWFGILTTVCGVGCAQGSGQLHATSGRNYAEGPSSVGTDVAFSSQPVTVTGGAARACIDVPDAELRVSPLASRRILAVEPVQEGLRPKKIVLRLVGARIFLLASPGLTREWLGHLLECHTARHAGAVAEAPDPLAVGGSKVDVVSTSNGFAVEITSRDLDEAKRILRDSEALLK